MSHEKRVEEIGSRDNHVSKTRKASRRQARRKEAEREKLSLLHVNGILIHRSKN